MATPLKLTFTVEHFAKNMETIPVLVQTMFVAGMFIRTSSAVTVTREWVSAPHWHLRNLGTAHMLFPSSPGRK